MKICGEILRWNNNILDMLVKQSHTQGSRIAWTARKNSFAQPCTAAVNWTAPQDESCFLSGVPGCNQRPSYLYSIIAKSREKAKTVGWYSWCRIASGTYTHSAVVYVRMDILTHRTAIFTKKTKKTCLFSTSSSFSLASFSLPLHLSPTRSSWSQHRKKQLCGGVPSSNHHDWKLKPAWMGLKMEYK